MCRLLKTGIRRQGTGLRPTARVMRTSITCQLLLVLTFFVGKERCKHETTKQKGPDMTSMKDPQTPGQKHFIYGKLNHKVKVYVKVKSNSPYLVCMDEDIAHKELLDPYVLWIGPNGRHLKGQSNTDITDTGKLVLKLFDKSMSGSYSCTLSYSSIADNLRNEEQTFKSYSFIVLAYREPDYTYRISVRYTAKPCDQLANTRFFQDLVSVVQVVVDSLTCKVTDIVHKCHVVQNPEGNLKNELFISFSVSPFGHKWEDLCKEITFDCEDETNRRVQKARDLIEEFFTLQPMFLKKEFAVVPVIKYIEHSMEIRRIDSCQPGFGKNEVTHNDCVGCCVVCDPDTFNSMNNDHCQVCKNIQVPYYGATVC
uniref:Zona pellucida binding protein 2 n=1 Tax=Leptobrachium leishanense TaxID=445787 RepID=A0A8C5QTD7_9ANUR